MYYPNIYVNNCKFIFIVDNVIVLQLLSNPWGKNERYSATILNIDIFGLSPIFCTDILSFYIDI